MDCSSSTPTSTSWWPAAAHSYPVRPSPEAVRAARDSLLRPTEEHEHYQWWPGTPDRGRALLAASVLVGLLVAFCALPVLIYALLT